MRPNATCDTPITSVDFLPTFAALAGAELPTSQPIDGVNIAPLLSGEPIAERGIFWHYPLYLQGRGLTIDTPGGGTYSWRGFPSTAMRDGKWKMIDFLETQTACSTIWKMTQASKTTWRPNIRKLRSGCASGFKSGRRA